MGQKFNLICSDPAYDFSDKLKMDGVKRSAKSQYKSVLTIEDIKKLPVKDIAADDALLCLWVPSALLQEGLDIMKAYGFHFKQTLIWVKVKKNPFASLLKLIKQRLKQFKAKQIQFKDFFKNLFDDFDWNSLLGFGMGHYFRQCHEVALIGVRGKMASKVDNKSLRSVVFAPNLKHSAKPEIVQDLLDEMFPDQTWGRLELFARRDRPGWTCLGNENKSSLNEDIRDSLNKLL